MAHPKRKHSKTRRDKSRTHQKLVTPQTSVCPACHQPKLSHRVCPHCGQYKGKQYIVKKEKKPKK